MGGLGNQMFQYAFGKYLALRNNTEIKLDLTLLNDRSQPHEIVTHRGFDLDIFNISGYSFATPQEIVHYNGNPSAGLFAKVKRKIRVLFNPPRLVVQDKNKFSEEYLRLPGDVCIVGRWQSERFFSGISDTIRKEFTFREKFSAHIMELARTVAAPGSVCLHVRRGDLLTSPVYSKSIGSLGMDYYARAVEIIKAKVKEPRLYVFSDDVEWCRDNLRFDLPVSVVGNEYAGHKSGGHLFLMTQCNHFIISNSTFAWWGAWLSGNAGKTVIAPFHWYKDEELKNEVLFPGNWNAI